MSNRKTIKVNPTFLNIKKSKNKSLKRRDRHKLHSQIKPNNIKATLMNRIKQHQNRNKLENAPQNVNDSSDKGKPGVEDFSKQLGYLENIIKSKKEKRRQKKLRRQQQRNKTPPMRSQQIPGPQSPHIRQGNTLPVVSGHKPDNNPAISSLTPPPLISRPNVSLHTPSNSLQTPPKILPNVPVSLTPPSKNPNILPPVNKSTIEPIPITSVDPPYGCLKNGRKPTFSQYRRTLKNPIKKDTPKINFVETRAPPISDEFNVRQGKLEDLKLKMQEPRREKPKMRKLKRTIKIFKLGKIGDSVGVLVKSGKTRKLIKDEQVVLKERCMSDVKKYLRKHNLIKTGTTAPEDVLRKLYEDSFLAGDIFNKNPDNLLHNYLNLEDV